MNGYIREPSDRYVKEFEALVPARIELEGSEVVLAPLSPLMHAKELFKASHETEQALSIWDFLAYGPYGSICEYKKALRVQAAAFDPIYYVVMNNRVAKGQISLLDINADHGVIEIGHIWFAPSLQRTRAATEALFLILCYVMDELNYRRVQWRCNALNQKSRNAAIRLGFTFEGIFFNHMCAKNKNRDTAFYSIISEEWGECKRIISEWLKPENFDESGHAYTSLSEKMNSKFCQTQSGEI